MMLLKIGKAIGQVIFIYFVNLSTLCSVNYISSSFFHQGVRSSRRMLKPDAIPSRMLYLQPEIPGSCIKIRIRKPLFKADSLPVPKSLEDDKEFLCSETFQGCTITETSSQNFEEHKLTLPKSNNENIKQTNFHLESSLCKFIETEQNNCCHVERSHEERMNHSETSLNEQSDLILELADFYSNFCMQVEEKETLTIYPSDDLSSNEPTVIIDTTLNTN